MGTMKTFKEIREQMSSYEQHKKRVQKIPKGSQVSFTHHTGSKVTGTYKGLKQMGGRSYAHVEHEKGATYVPVHQIH
jgi:F0F1-type ATP synthase gamma subunit